MEKISPELKSVLHPENGLFFEFKDVKESHKAIGGKAYGLARLSQIGLNVPAGMVITKPVENESEWKLIKDWWTKSGLKPLAIRSSYEGEDSSEHSFAGQNKSFLNVTDSDSLKSSIKECFESAKSNVTTSYQKHFDLENQNKNMNVVIQLMVEPLFSGVYFSIDPNGSEWLIEYVQGLGEDLVSGKKTPFQVKNRDINHQHERWKSKFTEQIIEAGERVKTEMGFEPDMEWAIDHNGVFVMLQARPITTKQSHAKQKYIDAELKRLKKNYSQETCWDSQTFAEWTGFPSYLTFSIWKNAFSPAQAFSKALEKIGYASFSTKDFGPKSYVLERVFGRAYINLDKLCELYFGSVPYRIEPEPRPHLKFDAKKITLKSILTAPVAMFRMIAIGWRLSTQSKSILNTCRENLLSFRNKLNRPTDPSLYATLSDDEILKKFHKECIEFSTETLYWPLVLVILTEASLKSLQSLISSIYGKEKSHEVIRRWMSSGIHTVIYEMNSSYQKACKDPSTRNEFIANFGHRGPGEMDLANPRWVEIRDKAFLDFSNQEQISSGNTDGCIVEDEISQIDSIRKELILIEWKRLKSMLELREQWKMEILKPYAEIRFIARELGRRSGLKKNIFWLRLSEITHASIFGDNPTEKFSTKIADRKSRFEAFHSYNLPERIKLSEIASYLSGKSLDTNSTVNGLALSPGLAKGVVQVIKDISEVPNITWNENTILVADATDPGWTPLFIKAKGIIVSKGGALSHCAIVAREMKKPAVSGIANCTTLLKTGMTVWVDGDHGRIIIE